MGSTFGNSRVAKAIISGRFPSSATPPGNDVLKIRKITSRKTRKIELTKNEICKSISVVAIDTHRADGCTLHIPHVAGRCRHTHLLGGGREEGSSHVALLVASRTFCAANGSFRASDSCVGSSARH